MLALALLALLAAAPAAHAGSVRFFGNGVNDIDRIKIRIDDPNRNSADEDTDFPADVGGDFTIEFWIKGTTAENSTGGQQCGNNQYGWIDGHIVLDRDRANQNGAFGISVNNQGFPAFGANGNATFTLCATTNVLDGDWHHVAVTRRTNGELALFVDGGLEQTTPNGPTGDISYPNSADPPIGCGPAADQSCDFSDPFIVLGAEKHDLNATGNPSFSGFMDELRISEGVRYPLTGFTPSSQPFALDASTRALYHFDEPVDATVAVDQVGKSPGEVRRGGSPEGPQFVADTPFASAGAGSLQFSQAQYQVAEAAGALTALVTRTGGSDGAAAVTCTTTNGSAQEPGDFEATNTVLNWANGDSAPKPCSVPIVSDATAEGEEEFGLQLSQPNGAQLGIPAQATVTLSDNSPGGVLRFIQQNVVVAEDAGSLSLAVTRGNGSAGIVEVRVTTQNGTATAGSDYTAVSTVLTWQDGETGQKIAQIPILNDTAQESDETFTATLSDAAGGASIGSPGTATITISANDGAAGGGGGGGGSIDWLLLAGLLSTIAARRRRAAAPGG